MNDFNFDNHKGQAPDPSEMLFMILAIAGMAKTSMEEGKALRDEAARSLQLVSAALAEINMRFDAQDQNLRRMYAPEAVRSAVGGANQVLSTFEHRAEAAFNGFSQKLDQVLRPLSLRVLGVSVTPVVTVLAGLFIFGATVVYLVPPLDEVLARRRDMANQPVNIVTVGGKRFVKLGETQTLCDDSVPKVCAKYGRVD